MENLRIDCSLVPASFNTWRLLFAGAGLLALVGMLIGIWAVTGYYRPLLDAEHNQVAICKAAGDNLAGLATEQGKALGDLVLTANIRQAAAEQAVSEAKASADIDYAAAYRLQQECTDGEQCTAAVSIIDKELGLLRWW